jgi:hypothetical protein
MRFLIPLLLAITTSVPLKAVTYTQADLDRELAKSELEADVEVLGVQNFVDASGSPSQRSTLRLENIRHTRLRNSVRDGEEIAILTPGGELDGMGTLIGGYPRPRVGERYRASLVTTGVAGEYKIVGFEQGFVPLSARRGFSRNRTDGSNGTGIGPFLFWDDAYFPIPYFIAVLSFRTHPEYVTAIDSSFGTWRSPGEIKVDFMAMGCSSTSRNENDGINNIVLVTQNWPYDSAAIAVTRNFYIANNSSRGGQILDSDILFNGVDHQFTTSGEAGKHDIQNIITHEIGHFLGLGHEVVPKDTDATMYEVANTGEINKRSLNSNDLGGIRAAYPGAGTKIGTTTTLCQIPSGAINCAAVKAPADPVSNAFPFLFLFFVVYLVRVAFPGLRRAR